MNETMNRSTTATVPIELLLAVSFSFPKRWPYSSLKNKNIHETFIIGCLHCHSSVITNLWIVPSILHHFTLSPKWISVVSSSQPCQQKLCNSSLLDHKRPSYASLTVTNLLSPASSQFCIMLLPIKLLFLWLCRGGIEHCKDGEQFGGSHNVTSAAWQNQHNCQLELPSASPMTSITSFIQEIAVLSLNNFSLLNISLLLLFLSMSKLASKSNIFHNKNKYFLPSVKLTAFILSSSKAEDTIFRSIVVTISYTKPQQRIQFLFSALSQHRSQWSRLWCIQAQNSRILGLPLLIPQNMRIYLSKDYGPSQHKAQNDLLMTSMQFGSSSRKNQKPMTAKQDCSFAAIINLSIKAEKGIRRSSHVVPAAEVDLL